MASHPESPKALADDVEELAGDIIGHPDEAERVASELFGVIQPCRAATGWDDTKKLARAKTASVTALNATRTDEFKQRVYDEVCLVIDARLSEHGVEHGSESSPPQR